MERSRRNVSSPQPRCQSEGRSPKPRRPAEESPWNIEERIKPGTRRVRKEKARRRASIESSIKQDKAKRAENRIKPGESTHRERYQTGQSRLASRSRSRSQRRGVRSHKERFRLMSSRPRTPTRQSPPPPPPPPAIALRHVPVNEVNFTHDTIKDRFQDGRSLDRLISELLSGEVHPLKEQNLQLDVFNVGGKLFSLNNRRLKCLKEYQLHCKHEVIIAVQLTRVEGKILKFLEAFTSQNSGQDVVVKRHRLHINILARQSNAGKKRFANKGGKGFGKSAKGRNQSGNRV